MSNPKEYYKMMDRSEKAIEKRILKEKERFKDQDAFQMEDYIIDLENKIKELNEEIRQLKDGQYIPVQESNLFGNSKGYTITYNGLQAAYNSIDGSVPDGITAQLDLWSRG